AAPMLKWTPTACKQKRIPNQRASQVTIRIEPARRSTPRGAAAPARNAVMLIGSRRPRNRWSTAASTSAAAEPPIPAIIVQRAQAGTGRKNVAPAPRTAKAIISSRCAHRSEPPAREKPGYFDPDVTLRTATFEASPRRPGRTVPRKEPIELEA